MSEKEKYISNLEEQVVGDILTVVCTMKHRKLSRNPVIKVNTSDIISILEKKYKILSCLQETRVCNCPRSKTPRKGTWEFKILKQAPPRPRRKPSNPTPKPSSQKNNVTKPVFSDRIKNIADKKKKEKQIE